VKHIFRFFGQRQPEQHEGAFLWEITDSELQHLKKTLRLSIGTEVEVFNGQGEFSLGVIADIEQHRAIVEASELQKEQKLPPAIHIGMGALKPGFIDDLLPSLVELGVDHLHFYLQDGVEKTRITDKSQERWERIILSAAKQCKRAYLPSLRLWKSVPHLIENIPAVFDSQPKPLLLNLHPESSLLLAEAPIQCSQPVLAVLGGEGGWSPKEEQILDQNAFIRVGLGPNILRAYTAAIAVNVLLSNMRFLKKENLVSSQKHISC
jgi:16S rRNA (uracil1498-N3)-methyltransferase